MGLYRGGVSQQKHTREGLNIWGGWVFQEADRITHFLGQHNDLNSLLSEPLKQSEDSESDVLFVGGAHHCQPIIWGNAHNVHTGSLNRTGEKEGKCRASI